MKDFLQNVFMTPWERVTKELKTRGLEWKALGEHLDASPSKMGNWKTRGIPHKYNAQIAEFFGQSVDWLLGIKTPQSWPFDLVDMDDYESLPLPSRHAVQVRMQDAIEKELAKLAEKQEAPYKASRAA